MPFFRTALARDAGCDTMSHLAAAGCPERHLKHPDKARAIAAWGASARILVLMLCQVVLDCMTMCRGNAIVNDVCKFGAQHRVPMPSSHP